MKGTIDFAALYEAFFKQSLEGILVVDKTHTIRFANPGAEKMLGYEKDELNDKKLDNIVPIKFHQECYAICDRLFDLKEKHSSIKTIVTFQKQKKVKVVAEIELARYLHPDEGTLLIGIFSDITKRFKAERDLEEEKKLYINVLEKMEDCFISFDHEWRYTYINDKAFRFFDQTKSKASYINRELWVAFPKLKGTIFETEFRKVMEKRESLVLESDAWKKDNWFEITVFPHDGGIAVFYKDITEKRNSQVAVHKQNEILERKVRERTIALTQALKREKENNDLKSRFVSTASHEFRTPLACLLTSVSILERYFGPEKQESVIKHFNRIKSSVKTVTEILDDLLSLEKLELGKIQVASTFFNLEEILKQTIDEMGGILKQGQCINYVHKGDPIVFQDKKIIQNTLVNLISNAIKYSSENTTIDICTEIKNKNIVCAIKDEGMGIPKTDQKNIFSLFFRAKNAETIEGTGLGLSIVKKYMTLIDGKIHFSSVEKKGSTFTIIFPKMLAKN